MAKGDYATAQVLAETGKQLRQFQEDVEALRKRWREVSGRSIAKGPTTPLWMFFQPVLKALVIAGGECTESEVEEGVERLMASSFLPADRSIKATGREHWRRMVRRARKPMSAEGWIERRSGRLWKITEAGRQTAHKPIRGTISTSRSDVE
jgi:hypothetical protein